MLGALRHGEIVAPKVEPFTWVHESDGWQLRMRAMERSVPHMLHRHLTAGNAVHGSLGGVDLHSGLLLLEKLEHLLAFFGLLRALIEAKVIGGGHHDLAHVLEHADFADEVRPRLKELLPAVVDLAAGNFRRIVDQTR